MNITGNPSMWIYTEEFVKLKNIEMTKSQKLKKVKDYIKEHQLDEGRVSNQKAWTRFYLFAYMKQTFKDMSTPEIGRYFNKDHSSVVYGIKKHNEWFKDDYVYRRTVDDVRNEFPMKEGRIKESVFIQLEISKETQKRLKVFMVLNDFEDESDAITEIIENQTKELN
jgi:hypothetical protein